MEKSGQEAGDRGERASKSGSKAELHGQGKENNKKVGGTQQQDRSPRKNQPPLDKGRMVPDGYAYMWNVYAYDATTDSVVMMFVDAEGVFDGYMLGTDEEGEEVDFSILKSLPELYIDSDSAMVIASEMGGDDFLDYYSGDEDSEYLSLIHI